MRKLPPSKRLPGQLPGQLTRVSLKRGRQPRQSPSLLARPGTLLFYLEPYLEHRRSRHLSDECLKSDERLVSVFIRWAGERGLERAEDVTRNVLEQYQKHLYHYRKKNGQPYALKSQLSHMHYLRAFFKWLAKNWYIQHNPAADLDLPRRPRTLPRHVLTAQEVESIMRLPSITDPVGMRDRALLELLYSTGARRSELSRIKLYDLDLESGTLFIDQGKGKKDRVIPVGRRALLWLDKYIRESRPRLVLEPDSGYLFLSVQGDYLAPGHLGDVVMKYVQESGVNKPGACHLFRHTMATLMLEGGADVRYIQQMLGHSELSTTEVYTHVSIKKLKEVHEFAHPAKVERGNAYSVASQEEEDPPVADTQSVNPPPSD